MAAKKTFSNPTEPTKSELEILQVLWKNGPSTVRYVNDVLNKEKREVNYTTTLKVMQIMFEKGLLTRDDSQMKHIYAGAQEEGQMKNLLLERFVDNLYEGSAANLMMQLLGNKKTSKKELEAIKALINQYNRK
jgi:BlaI family transcriptional regulator, penicillinase repressor